MSGLLKTNMSLGHQKQMSGNPLGSQKSMRFGHQNKCQETFWALKEHEFWAPKTKVRKLAGLSKSMSFGTKKQMSGNPPGSLKQYMNFGHQNKCQETFWALRKHEFWTPTTNVRKLTGISKKHVFWAPKTNVRKLAGLSNNLYKSFVHQKQMSGLSKKPTGLSTKHEIWAPKHMSGNLLGSPELCVLGTQETR